MRRYETRNQDRHADTERTATDPKKFVEVALKDARPIGEISAECFVEFPRYLRLSFGVREVNGDLDYLVGS